MSQNTGGGRGSASGGGGRAYGGEAQVAALDGELPPGHLHTPHSFPRPRGALPRGGLGRSKAIGQAFRSYRLPFGGIGGSSPPSGASMAHRQVLRQAAARRPVPPRRRPVLLVQAQAEGPQASSRQQPLKCG